MSGHVNFHQLATEPRRRITRTFTDARHPGIELVIQFEEPDALTDYVAGEIASQLMSRYVTGDEALGMPAQPFLVGGKPRALAPFMCEDAGLIVALQPDPWDLPFERYGPEEVLQMAFKARGLWRQVKRWALELYREAEQGLPNASGGGAAGSSAPPWTPDTFTPPSSALSASVSGASTPASAGSRE